MARIRIPVIVVLIAAAGVAIVQSLPRIDPGVRFFTSFSITGLGVIALVLWLLVFSGWRWSVRLGVLAGTAAVAAALVWTFEPEVEFDGEMNPMFHAGRRSQFRQTLHEHRSGRPRAAAAPVPDITDDDFPEYRHRKRDGVLPNVRWLSDWEAHPPKLVWRQPCGGGFAGFAVVGPLAVTIEQRGDNEAVVGYDAESGQERWVYEYPAHFREPLGGNGPRATPTIAGGAVYSVGAAGQFVCLDATNGSLRWQVDLLADNANLTWGQCGSPLIVGESVIVSPGAQTPAAAGRALRAYDRATGRLIWASGQRKAGYSSPQLSTLGGAKQILLLDGQAVAGFDPETGTELWHYDWPTYQDINVAQPLVLDGDRVFVSSGYGHGCAMLKVIRADGTWKVEPLWSNTNLRCKFSSPVHRDGFIFGLDEAHLVCLDAASGARKWKGDRYGFGQILLAGEAILVGAENGRLALVAATPERFREIAMIRALSGDKNWNHLAVARGRAFVRNHFEMACFQLPMPE